VHKPASIHGSLEGGLSYSSLATAFKGKKQADASQSPFYGQFTKMLQYKFFEIWAKVSMKYM